MPIESLLVADPGVVGALVAAHAQALGLRVVGVHTDGGRGPGDESVLLGAAGSEADPVKVLEAARQAGAEALHPGAGPLAGDARFAAAVREAGLVWVGPDPRVVPALASVRTELLYLDGQALAALEVRGDLARTAVAPARAPHGLPNGLVTLVGDVVVPHLTRWTSLAEAALGLDLVAMQLRTAAGEDVGWELTSRAGAAAVVRGCGRVEALRLPDGVHAVSACTEGHPVPYDGVVALLVATAATVDLAVADLQAALAEMVVDGPELAPLPDPLELLA